MNQQAIEIMNWQGSANRDEEEYYVIPVVVHILHDNGIGDIPDEQVELAISQLNMWFGKHNVDFPWGQNVPFARPEVKFVLAKIDPQGNCTNGIIRTHFPYAMKRELAPCDQPNPTAKTIYQAWQETGMWPNDEYVNIYVCNEICEGGIQGFASMPPMVFNQGYLGVVIRNSVFGIPYSNDANYINPVLEHEFGHLFGLFHTHDSHCDLPLIPSANCLPLITPESDCATDGDLCCDTNPFPCDVTSYTNMGCNGNYELYTPCELAVVNGVTITMTGTINNIMGFATLIPGWQTSCSSDIGFTQNQVTRMHYYLETSYLYNLWQPDNLLETGAIGDCLSITMNPMQYCWNAGSGPCTQFFPSITGYNGSLSDYDYQWDAIGGDGTILHTQTNSYSQFYCQGLDGIGPNGICCAPNYQLSIMHNNCPIATEYSQLSQSGECCTNEATVSFPQGLVVDANNILPVPGGLPQLRNILEGADHKAFNGHLVLNDVYLNCSQNGKFLFTEESKLVINPGSLLKTNGNIFGACNLNWEGIRIVANTQGRGGLALNHGQVRHAVLGVYSKDENAQYDTQQANDGNVVLTIQVPVEGGVKAGDLSIIGTQFIDNKRALYIEEAVKGANFGPVGSVVFEDLMFKDVSFIVTDDLYNHFMFSTPFCEENDCPPTVPTGGGNNFISHVYLLWTKGAEFQGCTFLNEMTNAAHFPCGWQNRGVGIKANNALFTVDKFGSSGYSIFEGFHYGIQAYVGSFPWNGLRVSYSTFDKNKVAMFFNNTCFHDVLDCEINVGNTTGITILDDFSQEPVGSEYFEGICQLKGAYFTCADNMFAAGNGTQQTIGLRIRSTKAEDNSILHNNSFTGFDYANKADGKNFKSIGSGFPSGLRYTCQFNTANKYDFDVNGFAADIEKGIGKNQNGYEMDAQQTDFQAAGSTFSGAGVLSHFNNNGDHDLTYFARPTNPVPTVGVVGVNNNQSPENEDQNCDPYTNLVVGGAGSSTTLAQLPTWKGNMTWVKPQITQIEYLISSLIDGGSTAVLGDIIEWSNDTWAMRDQLLGLSPYLSKQTLASVADNTVLFPHPVALEIFVANPDVLRDNRFIEHLSTKADPMPGYMIDILLASRDVNTMRTMLGEQLAGKRAYFSYYAGLVGRALLRDTQADLAEMAVMMNQADNLYDHFTLIGWMLESGQISEAQAAYASLPLRVRISEPDDVTEYDAFGNWLSLRSQMFTDNITWPVAGPTVLTGLCEMADLYDTWTGSNGIGVGNDVLGVNWFVPPAFSQAWSLRSANANEELAQIVRVYPNPANQLVNFVFELPFALTSPAAMHIFDLMGRPMGRLVIVHRDAMLTLNTSDYPSGLYAYEVALPYGLKITGRFVVEH